eukprot:1120223-Pelagomonas_calceolata.AAC.3
MIVWQVPQKNCKQRSLQSWVLCKGGIKKTLSEALSCTITISIAPFYAVLCTGGWLPPAITCITSS